MYSQDFELITYMIYVILLLNISSVGGFPYFPFVITRSLKYFENHKFLELFKFERNRPDIYRNIFCQVKNTETPIC